MINKTPLFQQIVVTWPFSYFFDVGWPLVTLRLLLRKADAKSAILIYYSPTFNEVRNLTLKDPILKFDPEPKFFEIMYLGFTDHFELQYVEMGQIRNF